MRKGKKALSLFLAAALAISGINFASALEVNAENKILSAAGETSPGQGTGKPEQTPGQGTEKPEQTPGQGTEKPEGTPGQGTETPSEQEWNTLTNLIAQGNEKLSHQAEYTAETWTVFTQKLEAAKTVQAKGREKASKTETVKAANELDAAIKGLQQNKNETVTVNKKALNDAIAEAGKLSEKEYTTATWAVFQKALNEAKSVSANANATQQQVDLALSNLNAAKKELKAAPKPVAKTKKVSKVTISGGSKLKIAAGKKITLKATVAPKDASNKKLNWKSSNPKYAAVKNGKVTINKKAAGKTVTITATAADGSGKKASVKISIMKNSVTKISLKAKTKTVKAGKKVTVKATVKVNGKKANKKLEWSSSNTKWATVNSKGVVTAKKAGKGKTVTITAKATDGSNKKGTVKIKIKK